MAYKIRVGSRKQELKQPDEFISTMDRLRDWSEEHTSLISVLFLVAVVIGGSVLGFKYYRAGQVEKASALEFRAQQFFQQQSQIMAETAEHSPEENYKKSIALYGEVIEKFSGTPSAILARYYIGNAHLRLEDFGAAIQAYETLLGEEKNNPILRGLVFQRLGYAYLATREPDQAEKAFKSALAVEGTLNKDQVYYELGHLYHMEGRNEEAIQSYKVVTDQFPESLFLSEAQAHLKGLGVTEAPAAPEDESSSQPAEDESPPPVEEPVPAADK